MALIMTFVFVSAYVYAVVSVYLFEDYTKTIDNTIVYRDYFRCFIFLIKKRIHIKFFKFCWGIDNVAVPILDTRSLGSRQP
jgi:hypothetical protein